MESFYENKYYKVIALDEQVFDPEGLNPPFSYGVYNTLSKVVETYSTFLPAAITAAEKLSEELESKLPDTSKIVTIGDGKILA